MSTMSTFWSRHHASQQLGPKGIVVKSVAKRELLGLRKKNYKLKRAYGDDCVSESSDEEESEEHRHRPPGPPGP